LGFYAWFYAIFDRRLWRIRFLHRFEAVKVPNLTGKWNGYVSSSFDSHAAQIDLEAIIAQTWTQISIVAKTKTSISRSLIAIFSSESEGATLSYEYLNEPLPGAGDTMHMHRGFVRLVFDGIRVLDGSYYSGRDRQTFGLMHLERAAAEI
jgi:hypothetical protein